MRRIIATALIAFAFPLVAAERDFPLTLHVLGTSETRREFKRIYPDPCLTMALGAPCKDYEENSSIPGWAVDFLQITARLTHRGRTQQYELVCKSSPPKRPCAAMKYGNYPARWRGKRLEVLITEGKEKGTINRFEVKGENAADSN